MCPIRPAEPGDSWFERGCERTLPYPHLRCARRTHCKPSWKGNAHALPAMTLVVGGRPKGTASRGCRQQHHEAPSLQEQHGVRNDTRITIAVQRKIEAKCAMSWSRRALLVVFHCLIFYFTFVCVISEFFCDDMRAW